jgi:transposase
MAIPPRYGFVWSARKVDRMGLGRCIERLHKSGHSEREIARILQISASSVHRHLALVKSNDASK